MPSQSNGAALQGTDTAGLIKSCDNFALFNIDTSLYLGELFEKIIVPTIQDPNPITLALRIQFYRRLALAITNHSLANRPIVPSAPEMLGTFIDVLCALGLITI